MVQVSLCDELTFLQENLNNIFLIEVEYLIIVLKKPCQ